jgi:AcrR family transcriptional regulator
VGHEIEEGTEHEGRPAGPRGEAREQAILDAALELVMEVGYDRLSMDALAERAHASKATIYRRWSGKAQVVADAIRRRKSGPHTVVDTGTLRQDLLETLGGMCVSLGGDEALVAGVMSAMRTDPELAGLMRSQVLDGDSPMDVVVARAVARGELPPGASGALVDEVAPAVVMLRLVFRGEPLDDEFLVHLVDEIVLPLLRQTSSGTEAPHRGPPS